MTNYTDAQKAEAVNLYVEVGATEAAKQTGISRRSINSWAKAAGFTAQANIEKTTAAREVLASAVAEKREVLRELLLDAGIHHVERSIAAESGRDAQAWMTGAGIGIDKYRLEMGEATGRTEVMDVASAEASIDLEVERLAKLYDAKHA